MNFDYEDTRRELIAQRAKESDRIIKERLSLLIENLNRMIADPNDEALERQFRKNVASFERWMKERKAR